jgi:hypothetical protein
VYSLTACSTTESESVSFRFKAKADGPVDAVLSEAVDTIFNVGVIIAMFIYLLSC